MATAISLSKAEPWWEQLPEDFYRQADGTELDAVHPLRVHGTAAMDVMLRTVLGSVMAASMAPLLASREGMRAELNRLEYYHDLVGQADAAKTFVAPGPVKITRSKPRFAHYRPWGIPAQDLSFQSPYEPLNPALRDGYLSHKRNAMAHAQHWQHPDGPRKTLIFVHGVIEGWYGLNSLWFALKWFYKQGYDIVQFTLPFHGYRTERKHGFSGMGFFSGGFSHINEAMLQGVCDLRVILDDLFARGAPSVGVSGLSLGGYHAAMLAAADPRLSFCIPNSPVVTPVDMALDWEPTGTALRSIMKRNNFTVKDLRRGSAIHSPLSYPSQIDAARSLIIGGAGDRLTSPRFVRLLHEHWAGSQLHWFPGNHVIHLRQGEYLRRMKAFMDSHTAA